MITVGKRSKPIPVKLDDDTIMRLDRAAKRLGTNNRSSVIKIGIASVLREIEAGSITILPLPR